MKACISHPSKLTPQELQQCRSISFRNYGDLCWQLGANKEKRSTKIIRIFDKDLLVGWALLFDNVDHFDRTKPYAFQLYVRKTYRRKGIGTKLFNIAAKKVGPENIKYWAGTPRATEFYHHCFAPYKTKKEMVTTK